MIGRWIFVRDKGLSRLTVAVLLVATLITAIALLPMRLVLGWLADDDQRVVSARLVEGSIWDGRVHDMQLAGLPLGTLDAGVRPLSLLSGPRFAVAREETLGRPGFSAVIGGGDDRLVLHDANGRVDLAGAMSPLPVSALEFAEVSLDIDGGVCREASGTMGLVLPSLGPLISGETVLSGEARCEDGTIRATMAGPSGTERLAFEIDPDGVWSADLQLSGLPVEVTVPLIERGFSTRPNGIGFRASGSLSR